VGRDRWQRYGSGLKGTMRFSSVGLELALSVLLGFLAGDWLDGRLGSTPWAALAGVVLGSTAGFLNLWRALRRLTRSDSGPEDGGEGS